jgi:hypothetical protein
MNNWCIYWFFTHIFIFKGLSVWRLFKSFGVKGLSLQIMKLLFMQFSPTCCHFFPLRFEYSLTADAGFVCDAAHGAASHAWGCY